MKKLLTSRLTFLYKIVFPTIWTLLNLGLMIFIFIQTKDPLTFLIVLMLLPILLTIKLWQVSYDDKNVYLYNWKTRLTFELRDVKAINEGEIASFDPYFEIEIFNKSGSVKKFDFMPRVIEQLTFTFTKKYSGHLLDLRSKIIRSKQS